MPDYRRRRVPGGTYFFTITLLERQQQTGERGIWQRRFWEHCIRDDADYARHMDYIHFNPVKHGHVERVIDWSYSTFHRCVAAGLYPPDWGIAAADDLHAGER